jgi:hypothetical protein
MELLIVIGGLLFVGWLASKLGSPKHPLDTAPFLTIEDLSQKRDNV